EDGVAIAFTLDDQAHGHASDGLGDRHTGIHERHGRSADGGHGAGAVGGHDVGDNADGVRELILWRQHVDQRALGKSTVTDITATGTAHASYFADAVGREIVVMDVALAGCGRDGIEPLFFSYATE